MNVAMLAQRSFRAKHSPFGCWSGQRSVGPSGGARRNKVSGCAQDGSGRSSFPKGTKIYFNIFNNWGSFGCVCWLNISPAKD